MNTYRPFHVMMLAATMVMGAASCTITKTPAPPLTGPSELALSLAIAASPDILPANGASTAVISIVARDANAQPQPGVRLRVDTVNGETIIEQGLLQTHDVTTDSAGQASIVFTAPVGTIPGIDTLETVTIRVLPVSTNFALHTPRYVIIRLVPPTTIYVVGAPIPAFTFSPSAPKPNDIVIFNASGSIDPDGTITSYTWDWNDGESATKVTPTEDHDFAAAGTYYVKLTVTDNSGQQSFLVKPVVVK